MYNGIGLSTPRGSGTNGYVVRNLSFIKPPRQDRQDRANQDYRETPKTRKPNAAILDHDRKRKIEVKCMEHQLKLEEEGLTDDAIEEKVQALREKLLADLEKMEPVDARK
ncbi:cwf21 domain-containing protein [Gilbertella persicaria]|uniref:cwf21 domain-containing protein n=1 Tax=Gilbertella persicaria TaxID=101096 RepID=UPI00222068A3|nr:cwf21 domain-containing protein [Gilbertella persicaria]KAI8074277.1 cwf21 domain-containing protein [Gilbertella persicaria]